jgi:hypothetical protein
MTAIDQELRQLELRILPGEHFEAIHPAIDFNRADVLREREHLGSLVIGLLSRRERRSGEIDEAKIGQEVTP